jgi:hypothetical protein
VDALHVAYAQGFPWDGTTTHLDRAWATLRDHPPFVELMKPKGQGRNRTGS